MLSALATLFGHSEKDMDGSITGKVVSEYVWSLYSCRDVTSTLTSPGAMLHLKHVNVPKGQLPALHA